MTGRERSTFTLLVLEKQKSKALKKRHEIHNTNFNVHNRIYIWIYTRKRVLNNMNLKNIKGNRMYIRGFGVGIGISALAVTLGLMLGVMLLSYKEKVEEKIVYTDNYTEGYKRGYLDGQGQFACIFDGKAAIMHREIPFYSYKDCVTVEEADRMGVSYSANMEIK